MNLEKPPQIHKEKEIEPVILKPEEILKEETGMITKLGKKTKGVARVLILFTSLSLGWSLVAQAREKFPAKPKYTIEEVESYKRHPSSFLANVVDFKDIQGLDLAKEISQAAESDPAAFLFNAKNFKDIQGLDLAKEISKAAESDPGSFLENAKHFEDIQGLNLAKEISQINERYPKAFLRTAKFFQDIQGLDLAKEISQAAESEPYEFLYVVRYLKDIQGLDLIKEISQAAEHDPEGFLDRAKSLENTIPYSQWSILVEKSLMFYPEMTYDARGNFLLGKIKEPQFESTHILKKLTLSRYPETVMFFNEMVRHGLSENEAVEIMKDSDKTLKMLIKIKSEPEHLGQLSVENNLKDISLKRISQLNALHESPDAVRFSSVDKLTAAELYTLMVYGEEEIFTSSFNGMFTRLLDRMRQSDLNGKTLLEQVGQNKFRTFIKEITSFNRLNEFLSTMDKDSVNELLSDIVRNLDKSDNKLAQAASVAEIFSTITDKEVLKVLQNEIKLEYER